ncbi:MAG: 50S ribosomal protein L21, partial [Thermoplasmata archaeon]
VLKVERLAGEPGASVALEDVLLVGGDGAMRIGAPRVAGASVTATILAQERSDKILILKKRRRKNSRRRGGHRQAVTVLKVSEIRAE